MDSFTYFNHPTAKRHLLSEDVIKLQDFQQRKLAVAHHVNGSEGKVVILATGPALQIYVILNLLLCKPHTTGNYINLFSQKLQRNELILRDDLKFLLHLCQSADDMQIARDAIYR